MDPYQRAIKAIDRLTSERDEARAQNERNSEIALHAIRQGGDWKARAERAEAALAAAPAIWLGKAAEVAATYMIKRRFFDANHQAERIASEIRALIPTYATDALRKIKADAVRDAAKQLQSVADNWDCGHMESRLCDCRRNTEQWELAAEELTALADRIEKGEA